MYLQPDSMAVKKPIPMSQAFYNIKGWHNNGNIQLDHRIVEELELDDYVNLIFSKGKKTVFLYIGYYSTIKKVGAAHSPLVCFTGQGWSLSDLENKRLKIGEEKIHIKRAIASIGNRKELLLYWFQAYDRTSSGTFLQKLNTLQVKLKNGREDNAFVRITVPMDRITIEEAHNTGREFVELFYPIFLEYIKEGQY
jgi:EpsI family protein